MSANEIRQKFLAFFKARGHTIVPSAPLIPEHDPTVLFTTAGMHPLVPYLLGQAHPGGKRIANVQKCLRTDDIEEVGDQRHMTFFEMLGNWSLGDYWKQEAITWSFAFLTDKDQLGLDSHRIYVSIFAGDETAPRDDESIQIWKQVFGNAGITADVGTRIFPYPKAQCWWGPPGLTGPCGPDTEIFFDTADNTDLSKHNTGYQGSEPCHVNCACGRYVEIWNDVFMEYEKCTDGTFKTLTQRNVDTGMGLERITAVIHGLATAKDTVFVADVYQTELFYPIMSKILDTATKENMRAARIIADHLRAASFLIADGVTPSNTERGYILRRLIRRAIRRGLDLSIDRPFIASVAQVVIEVYEDIYPEVRTARPSIIEEVIREEERFRRTLKRGLARLSELMSKHHGGTLQGEVVFDLYQSFGFPLELTVEEVKNSAPTIHVDQEGFERALRKHQAISRAGSASRFAGGLADRSEEVIKYHTATHLFHQALRDVLGPMVLQKGSNITKERLRFDFSYPDRLTEKQLQKVESIVNEKIRQDLPVRREEMTVAQAKRLGALGVFDERYGEKVSVYRIDDYSKEICGGLHVSRTSEIGGIRIVKEEGISHGIRRIRAVLTK